MIYYETTFKGKRIRIRSVDYRKLLQRFDSKNTVSPSTLQSRYRIPKPCSLCNPQPYYHYCYEGCPFYAIERYGCITVIKARVGKTTSQALSIGVDDVSWREDNNKEARRRLKRIREELRKFKRVSV